VTRVGIPTYGYVEVWAAKISTRFGPDRRNESIDGRDPLRSGPAASSIPCFDAPNLYRRASAHGLLEAAARYHFTHGARPERRRSLAQQFLPGTLDPAA
jgi:hypothetical protein